MMKLIGVSLILLGSGGFGISKAARFYRQIRQMNAFYRALEMLKCELNYTLLPLAELCRVTAERTEKTCAVFLNEYAAQIDLGKPRRHCAELAFAKPRGLCLPNSAQKALMELFCSLGRYDLDGENRLIQMTQLQLQDELRILQEEKKPMVKGYAALAFCTGAALAILLV